MNDLILKPDNSPESAQAMQLHFEIKASLAAAANALVDFCRQLKSMRDQHLYIHLGFENFEDYVEQAQGIGQRQAYTYIQTYEKLGQKLMADNSDIGITKLSLLTKISSVDREEFSEENNLGTISVSEMKKLIEEKNGLNEQISFLTRQLEKSEQSSDDLQNVMSQLTKANEKIKELSAAPVDVAALELTEIEKIKAATKKELQQVFEKEKAAAIKQAKETATKKLEKEKQAAAQEAVQTASKKLQEEFENKNAETLNALAAEQTKAAELEKKLKINSNSDTVKFSILFKSVQQNIIDLENLIENIRKTDNQTADKLSSALHQLYKMKLEE